MALSSSIIWGWGSETETLGVSHESVFTTLVSVLSTCEQDEINRVISSIKVKVRCFIIYER